MPPPTDPTLDFAHNLETVEPRIDAAESGSNGRPCPKHNSLSTAPVVHHKHRWEPPVGLNFLLQPEHLQEPSHVSGHEDPESSKYPYQPLQHGKHIRLLFLDSHSPASSSARDDHDRWVVSATLQNVELNLDDSSPQPYRVLSYEWGPPPEANRHLPTINLDGHTIHVRQNLHNALKAIIGAGFNKSGDAPMPLWVDALCLNQSDDNEKGHQMELMRDIFAAAETVLVCLGSESEETGTAMKVVDEYMYAVDECLQTPRGRMRVIKEGVIDDTVDSSSEKLEPDEMAYRTSKGRLIELLDQLCRASYWRRVWIIQEFVMAKDYILIFGEDYLTKKKFEQALDVLSVSEWWTQKKCQQALDGWSVSERCILRSTHNLRVKRLFGRLAESPAHQMDELRARKKENKTTLKEWMDLCLERNFGATDPRDYVYALLGISDDCTGKIKPDYTRSVRHVWFLAIEVMDGSYLRHSDHWRCVPLARLMGLPEEDALKACAWVDEFARISA